LIEWRLNFGGLTSATATRLRELGPRFVERTRRHDWADTPCEEDLQRALYVDMARPWGWRIIKPAIQPPATPVAQPAQ
jgi:hypothetical protein